MPREKTRRWYFSLRSPYSWFAYRDLTAKSPDVLATLEWVPHWDPDGRTQAELAARNIQMHLVPMSRAKNLYVLQDAKRVATARGLAVRWPIDRDPCWEVPHLAYLLAADHGLGPAFVDAAYRARWSCGRDICAPETIAEIAVRIGMPPDELAGAARNPSLRERGMECLVKAYHDDVFGVPFFVFGRQKFWGAERVEPFVSAVRDAAQVSEPETVPGTGTTPGTADIATAGAVTDDTAQFGLAAADAGHAGGCG